MNTIPLIIAIVALALLVWLLGWLPTLVLLCVFGLFAYSVKRTADHGSRCCSAENPQRRKWANPLRQLTGKSHDAACQCASKNKTPH